MIQRLGRHTLIGGDCLTHLAEFRPCSLDAIIGDPPYGLGFMGKGWDALPPGPLFAERALRALKPGAYCVLAGGTRTIHRLTVALEDAGFEIRDQLHWLYWQGFPKSLNIGDGFGTALKPAVEPFVVARKPLEGTVAANVIKWGTGAINVDAGRHPYGCPSWPGSKEAPGRRALPDHWGDRWRSAGGQPEYHATPRIKDPCSHPLGRWPANVYHCPKPSTAEREAGCEELRQCSAGELTGGRTAGSAGLNNPRAGAGRTSQGRGNTHPTVKPIKLMRQLVRLFCPPGGLLCDPFAGSGTTLLAAEKSALRHRCIAIERSPKYWPIIAARYRAHTRQNTLDL